MATMSLPNGLARLVGMASAVSVAICRFRLTCSAVTCQGPGVHGVDERLYVHLGCLRRLRLGADVGQIQTVAANQRRQELVREHPLRVVRVCGVICR